jgi:caa(3)-type oxidase subunit IV
MKHVDPLVARLLAAWLALLVLLLLSLGSAYLSLGAFNLVISLAIAAIKIALIVVVFMKLPGASSWSRVAAWAALVLLAVLGTLSAFEGLTREHCRAAIQPPASTSSAALRSSIDQRPLTRSRCVPGTEEE